MLFLYLGVDVDKIVIMNEDNRISLCEGIEKEWKGSVQILHQTNEMLANTKPLANTKLEYFRNTEIGKYV